MPASKTPLRAVLKDCTLSNINARKENHGEEKVRCVDFSVTVTCPVDVLDGLVPSGAKPWKSFLWNAKGVVQDVGCKRHRLSCSFKEQSVHFSTFSSDPEHGSNQGMRFDKVAVKDFWIEAAHADRLIELSFKLQLQADDVDEWGLCGDAYSRGTADLEFVAPPQGDMLDDAA